MVCRRASLCRNDTRLWSSAIAAVCVKSHSHGACSVSEFPGWVSEESPRLDRSKQRHNAGEREHDSK